MTELRKRQHNSTVYEIGRRPLTDGRQVLKQAESKIGQSEDRRQHPGERQRSRGEGGVSGGDLLEGYFLAG